MFWILFLIKLSQPANIGPEEGPRTFPSNVPRKSPKDPIWSSRGRPNLTSWDVLNWRPGDVLIWRSRFVPGRLIWDIPGKFSGRPLEDLQSTQTWMSQLFFNLSFRTYSIDQIYLKAFQHSRCIENLVKLLRWSTSAKLVIMTL